jgi:hypothetical protein
MSEERKNQLKKRIRQLTKEIGQAKTAHERMELSNLRKQRDGFLTQLADEFDTYFWVVDGQSHFGSKEEMFVHYQDPNERKKVRGAGIVSDLFAGRNLVKERKEKFEKMSDEEIRELVLQELDGEVSRLEKAINDIQTEINEPPVDFEQVDKNRQSTKNHLDGIDLSSLE